MGRIDQMESNGLQSTKPSQMVSRGLSTQATRRVSRVDRIDQMESNGLHSTMLESNGLHPTMPELNGLHSTMPSQTIK